MWAFIGLTVTLLASLSFMSGYVRREEIMANWSKYKSDPLYMFSAPLFKPDDDPRSRVQFASDNFFDVIQAIIKDIFAVLLQPVFKIFKLMTDAIMETLSGLFNIRALMGNMWKKWNDVSDMFMRRFNSVFHNLRVTFTKLYAAMEKSFGVAVSSIYAGLSTVSTVLSFVDLMIKLIIIIMVILVIMMIFLFFILFPVMPLILGAVAVLIIAGVAGAAGDTFCFTADTPIQLRSGIVPISNIQMGDALYGGGTVEGILYFNTWTDDLYELRGVYVSGNHIVYEGSLALHVKEHPDAVLCAPNTRELYCLITSNRKIPVVSKKGILFFADWEEIENDDELLRWNKEVFETLNSKKQIVEPSKAALESESAVSGETQISTPIGPVKIRGIHPGDIVLDASGQATRVQGIVRVSDVERAKRIGRNAYVSCGAWILRNNEWKQPELESTEVVEREWYSLFTEAGTFQLFESDYIGMRDFTDIGADTISKTYDWVLESVTKNPRL